MAINDHTTDYSQITDYIFVGSNLCKGGVCPVHSVEFKLLNINAEINLDLEHDEQITPNLDVYLRLPTLDHTTPTQEQLHIGAFTIHKMVSQHKRVYVHCHNGHGRSPMIVAAYFIAHKNMLPADAVALVKTKRPEIHLQPVQLAALEEFSNM